MGQTLSLLGSRDNLSGVAKVKTKLELCLLFRPPSPGRRGRRLMAACFARCFPSVQSYSLAGMVSPGLFRLLCPCQCFPEKFILHMCMLKHWSFKNACLQMLVLLGHKKYWWRWWDLKVYFSKLLLEAGISSWISIFLLVACIAPEETLKEQINPLQLQQQKASKYLSVKCISFWSPKGILRVK